jgi:hypothetical protein
MTNTGNKVYNIFINSANRSLTDKTYDFTLFLENDEIIVNNNEGVNINVASFSLLNSMYNVNQHTQNNTFLLHNNFLNSDTIITIPYGNYNVYTLLNQLNILLSGTINIAYNVATNTYTYTNLTPSWLKAKAVSRPIWSGRHGFNSCHPQHEACFVLSTKQYACLY